MNPLSAIEEELLQAARALGTELTHALAGLLKSALEGKPVDELKQQAEKTAVLAAYKAVYHRGGNGTK